MELKDKRIFVVEDDPSNLAITLSILRKNGATVFYDRWGIDTKQKLLDSTPLDVILLDLMFPRGITGFDIYDQIQDAPSLLGIPCVIVTANSSIEQMKIARDKGLHGYITKPIDLERFAKMIAQVINGEKVWNF